MALTINQTHPPVELCLDETYIRKILTIENTEGTIGETPYQLVHTDSHSKVPLEYFNTTSSKKVISSSATPYLVTLTSQNNTVQPDPLLKGTLDRSILGTYNNYKGSLLAMTLENGSEVLPAMLRSSQTAMQNRLVTTKENSTKIDNNWLNGTVGTGASYSSDDNKVVFTRTNNTIDPALLNIQRFSTRITSNISVYTLSTSDFTMPSSLQNLFVYENGLLLSPDFDYSVSNNTINFTETVVSGTILQFIAIV
jgi:hypothetical protein